MAFNRCFLASAAAASAVFVAATPLIAEVLGEHEGVDAGKESCPDEGNELSSFFLTTSSMSSSGKPMAFSRSRLAFATLPEAEGVEVEDCEVDVVGDAGTFLADDGVVAEDLEVVPEDFVNVADRSK